MLTESFIVATLTPEKLVNAANLGIRIHELQPLPATKSTFKKSSSKSNCIAFNKTHIFAAQADKAVVHVYSRERNNLEVTVPFPERIQSLVLSGEKDDAGILVLGTEAGRLILWELGTSRQIFTPQHHLQPITCLATDLSSNFLFSGSSDSTIHVWSLIDLLSFSTSSSHHNLNPSTLPLSPLRSLSAHHTPITAISLGHSKGPRDIAVSTSTDGTCIVWDYQTGTALHTYLLPSNPLCTTLDPADRALYTGFSDGSILLTDFYSPRTPTHPLHNPTLQTHPTQPPPTSKWPPPHPDTTAILSLALSHDSTTLLSGHADGKLYTWDTSTGRFQTLLLDLSAPITTLLPLPLSGFPQPLNQPRLKLPRVTKPQYETFTNTLTTPAAAIPATYTLTAQFTHPLPFPPAASTPFFQQALSSPLFPPQLLDRALTAFGTGGGVSSTKASEELQAENQVLVAKVEDAVAALRRAEGRERERGRLEWARRRDEEVRAARKRRRRGGRGRREEEGRRREMGEEGEGMEGVDEGEEEGEGELSSSTDEE